MNACSMCACVSACVCANHRIPQRVCPVLCLHEGCLDFTQLLQALGVDVVGQLGQQLLHALAHSGQLCIHKACRVVGSVCL